MPSFWNPVVYGRLECRCMLLNKKRKSDVPCKEDVLGSLLVMASFLSLFYEIYASNC